MTVPVAARNAAQPRPRDATSALTVLAVLRRYLLGLLVLGMIGASIELFLLGHTETWQQFIPFGVLALGFISTTAAALRPGRNVLIMLRTCMLLFIAAGLTGVYLHYRGNVTFELEMVPTMKGIELMWNALTGATPAGAPGFMVQLGLLGLVYTYRHPLLGRIPGTRNGELEES